MTPSVIRPTTGNILEVLGRAFIGFHQPKLRRL